MNNKPAPSVEDAWAVIRGERWKQLDLRWLCGYLAIALQDTASRLEVLEAHARQAGRLP